MSLSASRTRALGALTIAASVGLACGVGCAPSGNAGRTPRAGADSAAEVAHEGQGQTGQTGQTPQTTPLETASDSPAAIGPDVAPNCAPIEAPAPSPPPPPPPVASRPIYLPPQAGPYRVRVVDESHRELPRFFNNGRTYILGTVGSRYSIVVSNPTGRRVEAVVSVDGLDAIDGEPANYVAKSGYIVSPYGDTTIDGFRTSVTNVATFRFSSVADSYAGRLGQARDVGVIGVAFFPEKAPVPIPAPMQAPRPHASPSPAARNDYDRAPPRPAAPKSRVDDESDGPPQAWNGGGGAPAPSAPASRAAPAHRQRPGLGTEFGETRESRVETIEFARANALRPIQTIAIRYNDRAGLVALGIVFPQPYATAETDLQLRESADPFRANHFALPPP